MTEIIVAAVVGLLLVVLVARGVFTVPQAQSAVLERNGRFHRVAEAGLHFRIPLVDHVRARIDLREQVITFPKTGHRTVDDSSVAVVLKLFCQIRDVQAAVYSVANWILAVEQVAMAAVADEIDELTRQRALVSRRAIAQAVQNALGAETARWGISINSVELTIEPDES